MLKIMTITFTNTHRYTQKYINCCFSVS